MTEHLTEDEQVEQLKKWWKENGTAVITGVIIGLAGVIGVHYWFKYQERVAVEASGLYSEYMASLDGQDSAKAEQYSAKLKSEYKGTSYAAMAAMQQAKRNISDKKLDLADKNLHWAMTNSGHDSIEHLARIRLARVLIVQNKYDQALKLIKDLNEPAFSGSYAELRGDVYSNLGEIDKARKEYQLALASNNLTGKQREYVEMKLNDIAVNNMNMKNSTK